MPTAAGALPDQQPRHQLMWHQSLNARVPLHSCNVTAMAGWGCIASCGCCCGPQDVASQTETPTDTNNALAVTLQTFAMKCCLCVLADDILFLLGCLLWPLHLLHLMQVLAIPA